MTGTAMGSARELRRIYRCHVLPIPTNRPAIRQRLPDRVFGVADDKWVAVVEEVRQLHAVGRPVLIGTRSIDKSEQLSEPADRRGHRAPRSQRQPDRRRGRNRRPRRAAAAQ